ncbi:MAG: knotted carbamoyltransferase YgeW [Bacteroidales bacterium]|nr:knotted carbamoyltransferase YgeW [Bacteroidales bacterium]
MKIIDKIEKLAKLKSNLHKKDFLLTWEKSDDDLKAILEIADLLKQMRDENISPKVFDSGLAVSIFRDNSTRTRFSYASAANLLGLTVQDMDETKSQIAHGETVRETANMISFLTDFIGIRDDMYLGEGNKYMLEVAAALDEGFEKSVLPSRPGIVNLQCDMDHPTQSMADLLHLKNTYGSLEALKGKKIVMSWAYSPSYGKPMSVPQGIIALMTRFGMNVELTYPEGYDLIPDIVELAGKNAKESGGSFKISHSMDEAMMDADIVYPKSWAPFHIMQQRTELLKNKDTKGLAVLEQEALNNNAKFKHWEYSEEMMKRTKGRNALYMHCLPADISGISCAAGEVEGAVFEKYRIKTYHEAGYKPYIIAAMMFANKFKDPARMLHYLLNRNNKRVEDS